MDPNKYIVSAATKAQKEAIEVFAKAAEEESGVKGSRDTWRDDDVGDGYDERTRTYAGERGEDIEKEEGEEGEIHEDKGGQRNLVR